ncbi:MAG TPA: hypothetical protein VND22_01365 [Actinomycetota bacterium]|nr:hypothetical protein [Actinomycetota bacterium]
MSLEETSAKPEEFTTKKEGPLWLRRYPPLLILVLSILIAALVLPSALNLPQANPSTVLEYAPVPPDDESITSNEGSISELGLGSSTGLSTGAPAPQSGPVAGKGTKPISKRCVGKPLRQTEDPNSPPCVPFFDGDNGGKTWQGVTAEEITVILYHDGFISDQNETEGGDTSAGEYSPAAGNVCDLAKPSAGQTGCNDSNNGREMSVVAAARALYRYFNERFQTYGRSVHIYLYWGGARTAATRRAEAAAIWERFKPFAVIDRGVFSGFNDAFAEASAKRRVMIFGSFGFLANDFFRKNAPHAWSFWPDIERWADNYVSYVCNKVVPFNTTYAGDDKQSEDMNGKPRRLALMYTTDPGFPGIRLFKELVEDGVKACGGNIVEHVEFPYAGANIDNRCAEHADCQYGIENVAKLQAADVTTVLWLGGMESKTTPAADQARWYPEWVVAGDRLIDDLLNGRAQNPNVWAHAWVHSQQLREIRFEESPARQAFREAAPNARPVQEYWATTIYREFFSLFKAIQVAGPFLQPETVDQGQHAIPRTSSTDPRTAACFYDPGDYTCVKDAQEAWWDSDAPDPNNEPGVLGCWRMVHEGKRYLAGDWEKKQEVFLNPNDVCNGIKGNSHNYATG